MRHPEGMQKLALAAFIATSALVIIAGAVWGIRFFTMSRNQATTQSTNPSNYPTIANPGEAVKVSGIPNNLIVTYPEAETRALQASRSSHERR